MGKMKEKEKNSNIIPFKLSKNRFIETHTTTNNLSETTEDFTNTYIDNKKLLDISIEASLPIMKILVDRDIDEYTHYGYNALLNLEIITLKASNKNFYTQTKEKMNAIVDDLETVILEHLFLEKGSISAFLDKKVWYKHNVPIHNPVTPTMQHRFLIAELFHCLKEAQKFNLTLEQFELADSWLSYSIEEAILKVWLDYAAQTSLVSESELKQAEEYLTIPIFDFNESVLENNWDFVEGKIEGITSEEYLDSLYIFLEEQLTKYKQAN